MFRLLLLVLFGLFSPGIALGAGALITANVDRTLSDTENFGGCMAFLTAPIASVGLDCPGNWVSFSCTGDFAPKDAALRNFDSAQIAMLTGASVRIAVFDDKKHNGNCFGRRIEIIPE